MRAALAVLVLFVVAACGDNIKPSVQPDARPDVPGMQGTCGDGMITGDEECESGACCSNCKLSPFNTPCRDASNACDLAEVCDGLANTCPGDKHAPDGTSCGINQFCSNGTCGTCNIAVDADFDGSNQCVDCNDNNGLVKPQAAEHACEGLDDDCDGKIDEDYDLDQDGYSVCSDDPLVKDCNDAAAGVHPGATELCGTAGTGNGIDENCNGYVDETCQPCDTVDNDGDGKSECQGDCDDAQPTVGPGKPEACDGFDTDCNKFTTQNCDVSGQCNWAANDVCKDDLECGCILDANGVCPTLNPNYRCASFCEGSYTGPIGAGCTATQTCEYYWTNSDNQHACAETTGTIGAKLGGATCTADSECRSGTCDILQVGATQKYCIDFCDHDAPGGGGCVTGTVCETLQSTVVGDEFEYASCGLSNGTQGQDQTCTGGCKWGTAACAGGACRAPCGDNSQCPSGTHHCSIMGNSVTTGVWGAGLPTDVMGKKSIEVVPVCMPNASGLHNRRGGAACTQNGDCTSEFCDDTLKVCVELCSQDASCPIGMSCDPIYLQTSAASLTPSVTWGRACVNASFGDLATRM